MIHTFTSKLHWNYFIALERDLEIVSRYVEFSKPNFAVYSIELAHLLFAAASEVDAVAKLLCERVEPVAPRDNINDYRAVLLAGLPGLPTTQVLVPRYGISLTPWIDWAAQTPNWWRSYNRVKHERDAHFNEATRATDEQGVAERRARAAGLRGVRLGRPPTLKRHEKGVAALLGDGLGVCAIARKLGIPLSSAHRVIKAARSREEAVCKPPGDRH